MNENLDWINNYNKENNNEFSRYVFTNKYLAILMPEHHRARKDGYVYLHNIQAEKKLGRQLKDDECVHHVDKNKFNNDVSNLMVFKTNSDHIAFHSGCDITMDEDVWVARVHKNKICPICGNQKDVKADMCIECFLAKKSKQIPSKEELYNLLVSSSSLTGIARDFDVSYTAVKKWCIKYGLPYKKSDINELKEMLC